MNVSIIAAVSKNFVIGYKGKIPWYIPEDLKRFKKITSGHHIIIGRKTYEAIGHPLPDRTNVVITRNKKYKAQGCVIVNSFKEAVMFAKKNKEKEAFIIGGEQVYNLALPIADKIYLTRVHHNFKGDSFFPKINTDNWKEISGQNHPKDKNHPFPYDFIIFEKT